MAWGRRGCSGRKKPAAPPALLNHFRRQLSAHLSSWEDLAPWPPRDGQGGGRRSKAASDLGQITALQSLSRSRGPARLRHPPPALTLRARCLDVAPGCGALPSFTSWFSSAQTWKKSENTEAKLAGKSDSPASTRRQRALHTGLQRPPSRPRASGVELCAWNVLCCTDPAGGSECQQHSKIETNCSEGKCGWTME